nr:MAG TPA: hypothetical protein [Caudoviricetes sp.]
MPILIISFYLLFLTSIPLSFFYIFTFYIF